MSSPPDRSPPTEARDADVRFCLFVYGTLRSGGPASRLLERAERVGEASVEGTLYELDEYPALMLYGTTKVQGEIWNCPFPLLSRLDEYEGVDRGLFRRVAVMASGTPCWTYVAGPALASQLTAKRRVDGQSGPTEIAETDRETRGRG